MESTCAAVIDADAVNCCGASDLRSGTPSPPWTVVKVASWRTSSGRGSVWPKNVGSSRSSITSWTGSI